ncbi:MAG: group II intron reverse transcriptase/maturase, partial [bacterium]|nr:group II intron reverse transcriptase/maturase [bacterium]
MKQLAIARATLESQSLTGASTPVADGWHDIEWRKVTRNVKRLQTRIVKAIQEKRWGKVKALQRLLTRSFSGKALAVRRGTENQGKRTAGVDGVTWSTPESKRKAIKVLRQCSYHAQPLRRVYIPKKNGKQRPLSIPTMRDRAMQALYKLALDPIAETIGDPNSYGFRTQRSAADAIEHCFTIFSNRNPARWILEADIKSCFDKINHDWLNQHIPIEKPILQQWLKAGFIDKQTTFSTTEGTPQGGIISPVLMNLTLDGLEAELRRHFPRHKRQSVYLVRYADDFIISAREKSLLEDEVKPIVKRFLDERGLQLSPTKTHITHLEDGFDFLGQTIRRFKDKLIIQPSKNSVHSFLNKIRRTIRSHLHVTTGELIAILNPMIRGWANYHRHVVSKRIFVSTERQIFFALWRWARRRHPQKLATWIRQRYFPPRGRRRWFFSGSITRDRKGSMQPIYLVPLARISIQRHIKVKSAANPFDP